MKKKRTYIAFAILACLLIIANTDRLKQWIAYYKAPSYIGYPSLMPEIDRTISIRFDPSYHYNGKRPQALAKELARKWQDNGINLVFYRAYDPQYGAFYKTEYPLNQMGEFGKYDLLKYVIKECHKRDIEVFAWFHVLNNAGAWNAHPDWRARAKDNKDYVATGLQYPLCARNPNVKQWWGGFLKDFLENYPNIDGVDFGEPIISWSRGDACHCQLCLKAHGKISDTTSLSDIRAFPLTQLLWGSISAVHRAGKRACVTTVQTAAPSGNLLTPEQFKENTGFDLLALLHADKDDRPDIICPEFLWQEWKHRYDDKPAAPERFTPDWTEKAVTQFIQWVDVPVDVLTHLEITDFPNTKLEAEDFADTIKSAIQGGASGIDVYSSSQMDDKNAWSVLADNRHLTRQKQALVLHDGDINPNDAIQTGELLHHFQAEVTLRSLSQYNKGDMVKFDNVFYVGTESGAPIPKAFLQDIMHSSASICWLGFNIEAALSIDEISNSLGLQYVDTVESKFKTVLYKDRVLKKEDPWTNIVRVFDSGKCKLLATTSNGAETVPYAVCGGRRFWYFADVPSSYAIEGGRFLVFADLLHDIMNEDHASKQLALIRIEDVHPLTDPASLRRIADFLHSRDVPFHISLVPFYVHPENNIFVPTGQNPEFISAIKYMVAKGGTVVMHGCTHQRFGETTSDYEFWDPVGNCPPEGQNEQAITEKMEEALRELWSAGIYPLMWETPHYAGPQKLYARLPEFFNISYERRQAIDEIGSDQYLPYIIPGDRYGQIIIPENLGYIPLSNPDPDVIIEPARNMKVVRDGVASFFFHPFVDIDVLKSIVKSMQQDGYTFTNCADLPLHVKTSFGLVTNQSDVYDLSTTLLSGEEYLLSFPGNVMTQSKVFADTDGAFTKTVSLSSGEIYAVNFIHPYQASMLAEDSEQKEDDPEVNALQIVSNLHGEPCSAPVPLLLTNSECAPALLNEINAFASIFKLVGVDISERAVRDFTVIPSNVNLLMVPSGAANILSASQIAMISAALKDGRINLITSGISPLGDEIGIHNTGDSTTVKEVQDIVYSDVQITWCSSVEAPICEFPGEAVFLYQDMQTDTPLVIGSPHGNGKYIYSTVPLDEDTVHGGSRFPYFLSHVFRYLEFYPLLRGAGFDIYFNPAERHEDIAIEDLIKHWRRSGVRAIYVAAWQVFPEWTYDYERLIHLAHSNAMLVYAWFELPYVNEKFWLEHPEWREINALGNEAIVDWRKPMALGDPKCMESVVTQMGAFLQQFDWDGVVINRAGWESEEGPDDPQSYTPFHPTVRERFQKESGIDPLSLFDKDSPLYWKLNPQAMAQFEQFRHTLGMEWMHRLLVLLREMEQEKKYWEVLLTHQYDRKYNGIYLQDMGALKARYGTLLQVAKLEHKDWNTIPHFCDGVQVEIAAQKEGQSFLPGAPTSYPTGIDLYRMLGESIYKYRCFSLYTESSLYEVDMQMLPFIAASSNWEQWTGKEWIVEMRHSSDAVFSNLKDHTLLVDDSVSGTFYRNRIALPVGQHKLSSLNKHKHSRGVFESSTRIIDFSGNLLDVEVQSRGIEVNYRTKRRAVLVVSEEPLAAYVDGKPVTLNKEKSMRGWVVALPEGRHKAKLITQGVFDFLLILFSVAISNLIVLISVLAITGLLAVYIITRRNKKKALKNK
jgi:uncharacterized protein YdaL